MLYLDYSATTPPLDEVIHVIQDITRKVYGNPSSLHKLGVEAEKFLRKSREVIARAVGTMPEEIIFTSGGTESNNLAIKGIAMQFRNRGNHIITTQIEHASVYETFRQLESVGFEVTYLPVDSNGRVLVSDVEKAMTEKTILVSVMHVNNEIGTIQPIEELGELLSHYPKVYFHVDAVQSLGKIPLNPKKMGIDLMSISAHKIHGPKGIGFLYKRKGIKLYPLIVGGGQEFGYRSGTENVPYLVAMAKAVRLAVEKQPNQQQALLALRKRLLEHIRSISGLVITGSADSAIMAPHIVHFCYPGMKSEVVVHALEKYDIYISSKSACSSDEDKPSRVLLAIGQDHRHAISGLRISFSVQQSIEDIDYFADSLTKVMDELSIVQRISEDRKLEVHDES